MPIKSQVQQWHKVFLVLFLGVLLVTPTAVPAHAVAHSGSITGLVTDPDGLLPPPGTKIHLLKPDHSSFGQANVDPNDGSFSLGGVPNGNYILRATPPEASAFTPSLPEPVSVTGAPVDVGLVELTLPSVLGTVYAPDATSPTSAWIHIHHAGRPVETMPASGGSIKVGGLPDGAYRLQAWPKDDEPLWASPPLSLTLTSGISQTISLTLTPADVFGRVVDAVGNPVKEATARVVGPGGHIVGRDVTSATGYFAVGGLLPGNYQLTLEPPWWQPGLVPPTPKPFSVPPQQNLGVIAFKASHKIVQGKVETNTSTPVVGALVDAHRLDKAGHVTALSGAGGLYGINLSEGLWNLTVKPVGGTVPANWIYPQGPQLVHFKHDTSNETKTVNFKVLTADSDVIGHVEMPDGSTPPFTVTVGIHTDAGIGRSQDIDPVDGAFDIAIPHGSYKVSVQAADPRYLGPAVEPIRVLPNSTYNLETLTLLERNAVISGTVSDENGPVEGVPVIAWRLGAPGQAHSRSGPGGGYVLPVAQGTWLVKPAPTPDQPWLHAGQPAKVHVPDAGIVPNVDFRLTVADAAIAGVLVDESSVPVTDIRGWAQARDKANPAIHNGAPVEDGEFTVLVPAGAYQLSLKLPEGAPWLAAPVQDVVASSGVTTGVTLTLRTKDAAIAGALWDRRGEAVVTGVRAEVGGFSEGAWVRTTVQPGNGAYRLEVAPGIWALGYHVDPASGYVALRYRRNYPVASGQTVPAPLPVAEKDGLIKGIVRDPSGNPLPGATVVADGLGDQLGDLNLSTTLGNDGHFLLPVPHGNYHVRATLGGAHGWIAPVSNHVRVPEGGSAPPLDLRFTEPDATISGAVTLAGGGSHSGTVKLWAYSLDDGFTKAETELGGMYALNVVSNTVWFVGAAFQDGQGYWTAHARVEVPAGGAIQDLELRGPFPLPAPMTVSFDAGQEQYLELADGTSIFIPAGAMPVSGTVTLNITPIATFPHQRHANVYRYGYAFTAADANGQPIEAHFNEDVLVTFPYDEAELLRMGISEQWLKPAYFSTTTDSWTFPESYVVDTVANVVAMQIDHFTDFALTSSVGYRLFLPLVWR